MAEKPLAWNEIRDRAVHFAAEWRDETRENAEAQTFWNEWFEVFGIKRRRYVQFERKATRTSTGGRGRIDAFWEGQVAVEHKSAGKSLADAEEQALDYLNALDNVAQPRMVITSDFAHFRVLDLEANTVNEFPLAELPQRIGEFGFIAGYESRTFKPEDQVNVKAAEIMGDLYDGLAESGYTAHDLRMFLVRCMFLFFADDTGVWEKGLFGEFLETRTAEDGSDLGPLIDHLFRNLNKPEDERSSNLDQTLARFPYVNGGLFGERIEVPDFNRHLRARLIACASFDWSAISPAIFGSMFQSVMDRDARRGLGAHYTSEQNILKVIGPLFLDGLRAEFDAAHNNRRRLEALHDKIANLTFFDPAAGAGNFLIIAYREIRDLEFDILVRLVLQSQMFNAWVRAVGGRIKSDMRIAPDLVYNTFPFPDPQASQRDRVIAAARAVNEARESHPGSTLADLYHPLSMPTDLTAAHRAVDAAVDATYRRKGFDTEADRLAFLMERHRELLGTGEAA